MVVGDDEDVQIHDHDPRRESGNAEVGVSVHARQTWGKVASFDYSRRVSPTSYPLTLTCGISWPIAIPSCDHEDATGFRPERSETVGGI